jgi:hypothetical protein
LGENQYKYASFIIKRLNAQNFEEFCGLVGKFENLKQKFQHK